VADFPKVCDGFPQVGDGFPHNRTCFPKTEPIFHQNRSQFFLLEQSGFFPKTYFLLLLQFRISTHRLARHPNETTEFEREQQNWTKILFTCLNTFAFLFYFQGFHFQMDLPLFPSLWMQPPKPVDFISRLHGFYDIISKPCGFYNQTRWICFYTCFVFLPVSSFLFKPLQVKEFLRGQLQILDITMLTVFRAHLHRNCWNLLLLKLHSSHGT